MRVELVAHCFRYSRVFNYSASALLLHPSKNIEVTYTIFYAMEDEPTRKAVDFWYGRIPLRPWCLQLPELLNRSIGRNRAAKASNADVVCFIDVDLCFGDGALDALAAIPQDPSDPGYSRLWFPQQLLISKTHALGDEYSLRAREPGVVDIDPADFVPFPQRKAIGNSQLVLGSVAREFGYCDGDERELRPVTDGNWRVTTGDFRYRRQLETDGKPLDVPNLYRVRQSVEGAVDSLV